MSDTESTTTSMSIFRVLYSCHHLEIFHVGTGVCHIEVHDEDVKTMVASWPRLRSLEIRQPAPFVPRTLDDIRRPIAGIYTLQAFAESCPHLVNLALSVDDYVTLPCATTNPHNIYPPSRLRRLDLLCSPCGNIDYVTDFLRTTFPSLECFSALPPPSQMADMREERWQMVRGQLKTYLRMPDWTSSYDSD